MFKGAFVGVESESIKIWPHELYRKDICSVVDIIRQLLSGERLAGSIGIYRVID